MTTGTRYPQQVRERVTKMVLKHQDHSQWAAICSITAKFGMTPETLRRWIRRVETHEGMRPGLTTAELERLKAVERENRELRRANEILQSASAFFQDLSLFSKQAVLAAQTTQLLTFFRRESRLLASIDLGLVHPAAESSEVPSSSATALRLLPEDR